MCPDAEQTKTCLVGIAKSSADFYACFSLVITPHNIPVFHITDISVSILFACAATHVPWRTGRTKVALVELPAMYMFGVFCTSFPRRILAWSLPRSHFHPPKALNFYAFKTRMIIDRPTPATQNGLENVVRSWPRWMFCKAFKKQKLCSSWRSWSIIYRYIIILIATLIQSWNLMRQYLSFCIWPYFSGNFLHRRHFGPWTSKALRCAKRLAAQ